MGGGSGAEAEVQVRGLREREKERRGYEKRALFGNNADTRLHPHLHSSP